MRQKTQSEQTGVVRPAEHLYLSNRHSWTGTPRLSELVAVIVFGIRVVIPIWMDKGTKYAIDNYFASGYQAQDDGGEVEAGLWFGIYLVIVAMGMILLSAGVNASRRRCEYISSVEGEPSSLQSSNPDSQESSEAGALVAKEPVKIITRKTGLKKSLINIVSIHLPDAVKFCGVTGMMLMASTVYLAADFQSRMTDDPDKTDEQIDQDAHDVVMKYSLFVKASQVIGYCILRQLFQGGRLEVPSINEGRNNNQCAKVAAFFFGDNSARVCGSRLLGALNAVDTVLERQFGVNYGLEPQNAMNHEVVEGWSNQVTARKPF